MSLAVEINNLSKVYQNGVQALKDINLEIAEGEFFALLGANGAGKTTTIGIMTDLVRKTSGQVKIFGIDIDKQFDKAKLEIGVVPQEFNFNIFEKITNILIYQAGYYGISGKEARYRADELFDKLGLSDKKNSVSRELSGGMKRRLMIARALVHKPKLLILDEPTAGVDVELRHGMWDYLTEMNKEGLTILLTTHYLEEVEQLCDKAAIIKQGQIVRNDTVKNLLKSVQKETYRIETTQKLPKIKDREIKIIDENTLEIEVKRDQDINSIIHAMDKMNIKVAGIRPKGNRIEELFINTLKN